jgi:hypothetical protein
MLSVGLLPLGSLREQAFEMEPSTCLRSLVEVLQYVFIFSLIAIDIYQRIQSRVHLIRIVTVKIERSEKCRRQSHCPWDNLPLGSKPG